MFCSYIFIQFFYRFPLNNVCVSLFKEPLHQIDSSTPGGITGSLSDFRFKILTFIIVVATLIIGEFFLFLKLISIY